MHPPIGRLRPLVLSPFFVLAFLILASTCARAEISTHRGFNLPGHDYTHFKLRPGANHIACMTRCAGDRRCKAYTWVKGGVQGPSPFCWLKDTIPPKAVRDSNTVSGVRRFPEMFSLHIRQLIPAGFNLPGGGSVVSRYQDCLAKCKATPGCDGYTFAKDGGKTGFCLLKDDKRRDLSQTLRPNNVCTSGIRKVEVCCSSGGRNFFAYRHECQGSRNVNTHSACNPFPRLKPGTDVPSRRWR